MAEVFGLREMAAGLRGINAYGLCGVTGFLLGIGYLFFITRKRDEDFSDFMYVYVWAALGAVIGAKLLYLFLEIPDIMRNLGSGETDLRRYLIGMISGGFIFYGGLLGAVFAVKIASSFFALDFEKTISIMIPAMPLGHALGRVGCALSGCCYGRETRMCIGISYVNSVYAPNGVRLFPVQVFEAIADLAIFGVLVYILLKRPDSSRTFVMLKTYLVMYACIRFLLEFLRGDSLRGHWGWFSTSQWISMIILLSIGIQRIFKSRFYGRES